MKQFVGTGTGPSAAFKEREKQHEAELEQREAELKQRELKQREAELKQREKEQKRAARTNRDGLQPMDIDDERVASDVALEDDGVQPMCTDEHEEDEEMNDDFPVVKDDAVGGNNDDDEEEQDEHDAPRKQLDAILNVDVDKTKEAAAAAAVAAAGAREKRKERKDKDKITHPFPGGKAQWRVPFITVTRDGMRDIVNDTLDNWHEVSIYSLDHTVLTSSLHRNWPRKSAAAT